MNFLEQLTFEWYEYQGYFVRRNTLVGARDKGGYECELDIVAFHPTTMHIVHVEPSMDAHSWSERERRYLKKFEAGRKFIPSMIPGFKRGMGIDQIALFGLLKVSPRTQLAGGRVMTVSEFLHPVVQELRTQRVASSAVPEQYPLLRMVQFMCEYSTVSFANGA
ncbi:MAG: hypothetical protein QM776_08810 [Rhodocyclaceae bacterium]